MKTRLHHAPDTLQPRFSFCGNRGQVVEPGGTITCSKCVKKLYGQAQYANLLRQQGYRFAEPSSAAPDAPKTDLRQMSLYELLEACR